MFCTHLPIKIQRGIAPRHRAGVEPPEGDRQRVLSLFFFLHPLFFFSFPPSSFPSTSSKDQAWPRTGSVNVIRLEIAKKKIIERLVLLNEAPMSHTVCWVAFFYLL